MRLILHILTLPDDVFAREIIASQQRGGENKTIVEDLTRTRPNYKQLLENIFAADSVQVW